MGQSLIGIIGGTGLDKALTTRLENAVLEDMDTPFGKPSAPVLIGELGASRIAFLSRHGCGHRCNPSTIPYAANIFALKKLGVTALIASGAVGSLQQKIIHFLTLWVRCIVNFRIRAAVVCEKNLGSLQKRSIRLPILRGLMSVWRGLSFPPAPNR
jgi:purine nucleoside phosphorylase